MSRPEDQGTVDFELNQLAADRMLNNFEIAQLYRLDSVYYAIASMKVLGKPVDMLLIHSVSL